jgi:hypothetical protein
MAAAGMEDLAPMPPASLKMASEVKGVCKNAIRIEVFYFVCLRIID